MSFTITIAGRPNVGKSTLFNRLIGKRMAMVSDEPGVTRDWREGEGELYDLKFRLLDTAGLEDVRAKGSLAERTAQQTKRALAQTTVVILVVDARAGITTEDRNVARELRKLGKPIILVGNKCEGSRLPDAFDEFAALGFGEPIPMSATHGEGLFDLHEALLAFAPPKPPEAEEEIVEKKPKRARAAAAQVANAAAAAAATIVKEKEIAEGEEATFPEEPEEEKRLHVAVVGRPNAGKSTLINQLVGEERLLTGPEPGLTRDAIQIGWEFNGKPVRLVDTAGMRKRAKVVEKLEIMSVQETLRAIRLAHVVILVIDAAKPLDKQDLHIAHHVAQEGRALVIAVNKWDTIKDKRKVMKDIQETAESSLSQLLGVPLVPICALKGQGLNTLMKTAMHTYDTWNIRVPTGKLNRWLEDMEANHPPPITGGRRIKLRYITQVKSRPPTFSLWVNKPIDLPDSYQRFLVNGLRKLFKLDGVPIRLQLKKSANPYDEK